MPLVEGKINSSPMVLVTGFFTVTTRLATKKDAVNVFSFIDVTSLRKFSCFFLSKYARGFSFDALCLLFKRQAVLTNSLTYLRPSHCKICKAMLVSGYHLSWKIHISSKTFCTVCLRFSVTLLLKESSVSSVGLFNWQWNFLKTSVWYSVLTDCKDLLRHWFLIDNNIITRITSLKNKAELVLSLIDPNQGGI